MLAYQVDQCARWKTFVKTCNDQGLVRVWGFPRKLEDEDDPVVLEHVLPSGRTLITTDRAIHLDNLAHIPQKHSGILILALASPTKTMTMVGAQRLLATFKAAVPHWHQMRLRNSIVELTDSSVEVWTVGDLGLRQVVFLTFDAPNWRTELGRVLDENARSDPGLVDN